MARDSGGEGSAKSLAFKVIVLIWMVATFHHSAVVLASDRSPPQGLLWRYNKTVGWLRASGSLPKALTSRLVSLRHIDQTKSGLNGTSAVTNISAGSLPTAGLQFGLSAMAYISPHALWLIDSNGHLHARFWEAAQDRWAWEEGPLIPPIKSIELTGHSRWLCTSASDGRIFEMSLQLPPWQQMSLHMPPAQPTARWSEVHPPPADSGSMHTSGLTFGYSTFFVSESRELWELVRATTPTQTPAHSWVNHGRPPESELTTVVALHSVDLPSVLLQAQVPPTQMLHDGGGEQPPSWGSNAWTQQSITLLIFCICTENNEAVLWSFSLKASFTAGWLQATVHNLKGKWERHGVPPGGHTLTSLPAARIGGVFGESSRGGVFLTTGSGVLVERHWNGAEWQWHVFSPPKPGVSILSAPGGCINDRSIFVVGSDHNVWEFYRDGPAEQGERAWVWVAHGAPSTSRRGHPVMPTRATAMNNKCLFFRLHDGAIVERRWTGEKWKWFFHGLPEKLGALSAERHELLKLS